MVKVAIFRIGSSRVELLQAASDNSPIAKFLTKKGPGIHHIAYQVEDLDAAMQYCEKKALKLIDNSGHTGANGAWVAFVYPTSTGGILIELTSGLKR